MLAVPLGGAHGDPYSGNVTVTNPGASGLTRRLAVDYGLMRSSLCRMI